MGQLGVLFSLDAATVQTLRSCTSVQQRKEYVQEQLEDAYFEQHPQWVAELGQAWDALHRCLTDGGLTYTNGSFPLNHVILGGEGLDAGEDYLIRLKTPAQVRAIAQQVTAVTQELLHQRYRQLARSDYATQMSEADFALTWHWFTDSLPFWQLAAQQQRYVLFTVDQ